MDGDCNVVPGNPQVLHFNQHKGSFRNYKLVRHTYVRDDKRFLEGDLIAYVYAGEQILD